MSEQRLAFGPFIAIPAQRILLKDGGPVRVGGRALDLLLLLISRAGEVVPKDELIAAAWPKLHVEEANLRVHIGSLRKMLSDGNADARFIENVAGRGYCFVAKITDVAPVRASKPVPPAAASPHVIGRAPVIEALCTQLPLRRLVTVVGPGGIGKTTVTLAAAKSLSASYADGFAFVDLAPVNDAALITSLMAGALGISPRPDLSVADLSAALRDRRMLIVLDSCEHQVEAVADLAERLVESVPGIDILATSREPLRAKGEWVERLPPLGAPAAATPANASEALAFPAVQLFVERAAACLGGYELTDADAAAVADICRRLDGIALAIELAAGRVDTLGIRGLANSLKESFEVLTRGRRTALARHQTMRGTLDWSYGFLPPPEQVLFRRLAVFNGGFSVPAAHAVAHDDQLSHAAIDEALANLVAKSLVTATFAGNGAHYRLLEVTRAYGAEQLSASGEADRIARQHAVHYGNVFARAEAEWEERPAAEWLEDYAFHIDNLRAALDWAFSSAGDGAMAVALTATALPLWFQLSLVDECLARVEQALAMLDALPTQDLRRRMQLYSAFGWPQMRGTTNFATGAAAWRETLRLAEAIGDKDYQQRALWALSVDRSNHAEPREALAIAEKFSALAAAMGSPAEERIGERLRARALYLLGDLAGARDNVSRMLDRYVPPTKRSHLARFQYDQRLMARITLSRLLWLQGNADQARREIEDSVQEAASMHHTLTLAHVLADAACPVALMIGDLDLAEHYTAMLHEQTKTHSLDVWNTYAVGFAGEIRVRRGDVATGLDRLRGAIETLAQAEFILYRTAFMASLAQGFIAAGKTAGALATVRDAIAQCDRTGEAWLLAEFYRLRGEAQLQGQDAEAGEASLMQAVEIARKQGALAWELRAATSLARHWKSTRRSPKARALIAPVVAKFSEGFSTMDYQTAKALIA
jgi:predicted ATPase/DNA-binding winged helix-turn-helix (wHTH) protein